LTYIFTDGQSQPCPTGLIGLKSRPDNKGKGKDFVQSNNNDIRRVHARSIMLKYGYLPCARAWMETRLVYAILRAQKEYCHWLGVRSGEGAYPPQIIIMKFFCPHPTQHFYSQSC